MARVMIIDDEPAIATIIQEILTEEGHQTISVPNGYSGLKLMKQKPQPELLMIDLFLPGLSGREVINLMRADPELATIPVLLITGACPDPQQFPAPESYQGYLAKPFNIDDLIVKINAILMVPQPIH